MVKLISFNAVLILSGYVISYVIYLHFLSCHSKQPTVRECKIVVQFYVSVFVFWIVIIDHNCHFGWIVEYIVSIHVYHFLLFFDFRKHYFNCKVKFHTSKKQSKFFYMTVCFPKITQVILRYVKLGKNFYVFI
jgi:hypothetical protein